MLDPSKPALAEPPHDRDHALGPVGAPLTLVEYGDYECPSCASALPVIEQLRDHYGDRLRVIFRHFPMHSVHPIAGVAAEAAEAAAAQGRFWDMHRALYASGVNVTDIDLTRMAIRLRLDVYRFEHEMMNHLHETRVAAMRRSGERSGVTGTPTLFVNGTRFIGSIHPLNLRKDLDHLLEATS